MAKKVRLVRTRVPYFVPNLTAVLVSLDPETNEPGWILTKTGADNKPIFNKYNHLTQYIVKDSDFKSMYEPSADGPGLYSKR